MAQKNIATLRAQAQVIRDETAANANTALRVGGQHEDQNDSVLNVVETADQSVVSKVEFKSQAVPNSDTNDTIKTFTATPTFNFNDGHSQQMTLAGNVTTFATSNESAGGFYMVWIINDATAGRTVAAPTGWTKMTDSDDHNTDASAINLYQFFTNPGNTLKYYAIKNI